MVAPEPDAPAGGAGSDVRTGRADPFQNRGAEVELPGLPSLTGLYARGVAGSARAAAARRRTVRAADLPATRLLLRGLRPDRDHLTAYQHVVHEPGRDELPAGFVHVLTFPVATALMVRADFPLPLLGMVHVANRVEHRRALTPDDVLDVRASARDLRPHRAGVTVDVVAEVSVGEQVVWTGVSTYLAKRIRLTERTDAGHDRGPGAGPDTGQGTDFEPGADGHPGGRSARAFSPPTPTGQWRLPADTGRRYADVSGDRNPIHLSTPTAKVFGFPRAIAHGMYTAARGLADVGRARGDAYRWDVEFATPVLLPSAVAVRVAPAPDPAPGGDGAHPFELVAWHARRRRPHLTGTVTPLG